MVGLARREERVKELANKLTGAKGKLYALKCDVTKVEEVEKAFQWVKENVGPVQVLVNNAGIVRLGSIIGTFLSFSSSPSFYFLTFANEV